jgi:hypothetical protein
VNSVNPVTNEAGLQQGDVLLAINGQEIACDGTVPFSSTGERTAFSYLVSTKVGARQGAWGESRLCSLGWLAQLSRADQWLWMGSGPAGAVASSLSQASALTTAPSLAAARR